MAALCDFLLINWGGKATGHSYHVGTLGSSCKYYCNKANLRNTKLHITTVFRYTVCALSSQLKNYRITTTYCFSFYKYLHSMLTTVYSTVQYSTFDKSGTANRDNLSSGQLGDNLSSGQLGDNLSSWQPGDNLSSGQPGDNLSSWQPGDRLSSGQPGDNLSSGQPGDKLSSGQLRLHIYLTRQQSLQNRRQQRVFKFLINTKQWKKLQYNNFGTI